jgi:hypothetical protein
MGIGFIVTFIFSALPGIMQAFSNSEEAMVTMDKLLIGFNAYGAKQKDVRNQKPSYTITKGEGWG